VRNWIPSKMLSWILKRAAQWVLVFFLVTSATFLLSSLIPGDFFATHLLDPSIRPETVAQLRHRYSLDQPIFIQYVRWAADLLHLNLGYSLFYQRPVAPVVLDALLKTLWIGLPAFLIGSLGGIILGTLHGMYRVRTLGRLLDLISTVVLSLPSLVLGLTALLIAAKTHWFPLGSMSASEIQGPSWIWLADRMHHLILPVFCLALPILASVERIQAAAASDCLHQPFLSSAQSRGLSRIRIFCQYLVRPALNPVLSISGPLLGTVLSGSLVLEIIFAWPGLGQTTYDALFNNDLFLLVGCVAGSSFLLITGNLASDLLILALDPRTRNSEQGVRR
jgi:peptide/nickel transport system permease protein